MSTGISARPPGPCLASSTQIGVQGEPRELCEAPFLVLGLQAKGLLCDPEGCWLCSLRALAHCSSSPSLGAPLGDTGLSLPHSPRGRSSDCNGIAGARGGAAPGCPPLLGRPLPAGPQDCVLLRPTGRRWGWAPCPHEAGTCLTRPGAVASLSIQAVHPGKEACLSADSGPPTTAELGRGPPGAFTIKEEFVGLLGRELTFMLRLLISAGLIIHFNTGFFDEEHGKKKQNREKSMNAGLL